MKFYKLNYSDLSFLYWVLKSKNSRNSSYWWDGNYVFHIFSEIRPKLFGLHDFPSTYVFPSSFGIKSSYVDRRRWEFARNRRVWSTSFFKSFFCWEIETAILSEILFSAVFIGSTKIQTTQTYATYGGTLSFLVEIGGACRNFSQSRQFWKSH